MAAARTARKAAGAAAPARKPAYHHGDLARALTQAAIDLIAKSGPEAFTVREVARTVGVDHAAAYRHFADKHALLVAVAEDGFATLADRMQRALIGLPLDEPSARLQRLGAAYVRFALTHPSQFQVMLGPRLNEDGRFPSLEAAIAVPFGLVRDEMARGVATGRFAPADPRELAVGLWTLAHGFSTLVLSRRIAVRSHKKALGYFAAHLGRMLSGLRAA
jgi:AcrR family transcriptional regulator